MPHKQPGKILDTKENGLAEAEALYAESLPIWHELADPWGAGWALSFLAHIARQQGRNIEARSLYQESLASRRVADDQQGIAYARHGLGDVLGVLGDRGGTGSAYEESLAICREVGDRPNTATTLASLGMSRWMMTTSPTPRLDLPRA